MSDTPTPDKQFIPLPETTKVDPRDNIILYVFYIFFLLCLGPFLVVMKIFPEITGISYVLLFATIPALLIFRRMRLATMFVMLLFFYVGLGEKTLEKDRFVKDYHWQFEQFLNADFADSSQASVGRVFKPVTTALYSKKVLALVNLHIIPLTHSICPNGDAKIYCRMVPFYNIGTDVMMFNKSSFIPLEAEIKNGKIVSAVKHEGELTFKGHPVKFDYQAIYTDTSLTVSDIVMTFADGATFTDTQIHTIIR